MKNVGANGWFYYAVPSTTDSGNFALNISADKAISTYILKGRGSSASGELPGANTFDMLLKNETKVTLSSNLMNFD